MEQEALRELYYWMLAILAILAPLAIGITTFLVRRGEFDWRLLNARPRFQTHEDLRPIWDSMHYLYDISMTPIIQAACRAAFRDDDAIMVSDGNARALGRDPILFGHRF